MGVCDLNWQMPVLQCHKIVGGGGTWSDLAYVCSTIRREHCSDQTYVYGGNFAPPTPSWQSVLQQILRQTANICATHNPTNVLEFLHNKPAWLFDLADECRLDNTTYVEEEEHYCLPFDVDSTFSRTFGTKAFSIHYFLFFSDHPGNIRFPQVSFILRTTLLCWISLKRSE